MARPSYAAELDQYINEQLAQAQAQAVERSTQAQAKKEEAPPPPAPPLALPSLGDAGAPTEAQARAVGDLPASSSQAAQDDDEATLPYAPPRAPAPPAPGAAASQGYAGPYAGGNAGVWAPPAPSPASPGAPMRSRGVATTAAPAPTLNALALDEEITRLQQMRVWLSDPLTCAVIDKFIGQRLGDAERRQVYYSVAAGIVSLIIGWLLSAISPASVLVGLFHR